MEIERLLYPFIRTKLPITQGKDNTKTSIQPTLQQDEDFVIRHFEVDKIIPFNRAIHFDPDPLLAEDYVNK